jgi:hypothetical protein
MGVFHEIGFTGMELNNRTAGFIREISSGASSA